MSIDITDGTWTSPSRILTKSPGLKFLFSEQPMTDISLQTFTSNFYLKPKEKVFYARFTEPDEWALFAQNFVRLISRLK